MPSRPTVVVATVLIAIVALVLAWSLTPLERLLEPGFVMGYRDRLRALPFAPLVAIAGFVLGGFVSAPATLMIGATVLLFGVPYGLIYAMLGLLASAAATCSVVRYLFRESVEAWLASHAQSGFGAFNRTLERNGIVAIILMRLTPTPYMLQNLVAGASRVRLVDILVGTAIGVVPVITLMAGVSTRLDAWLAQPDWPGLALLIGVAIVMIALFWWLRRWAVRRSVDR